MVEVEISKLDLNIDIITLESIGTTEQNTLNMTFIKTNFSMNYIRLDPTGTLFTEDNLIGVVNSSTGGVFNIDYNCSFLKNDAFFSNSIVNDVLSVRGNFLSRLLISLNLDIGIGKT